MPGSGFCLFRESRVSDRDPLDLVERDLIAVRRIAWSSAGFRALQWPDILEGAASLEIAVMPVARNTWQPSLILKPGLGRAPPHRAHRHVR